MSRAFIPSPLQEPAAGVADWKTRLRDDRARAERNQTPAQRRITGRLMERALAAGADGFALTGSTARARRTAISDLDYHVIGLRPRYDDLPEDVDVYATDVERFWTKLREGDDMVHWTLRFACILHDSGVFREGLAAVEREGLWPDPGRHLARLPRIAELTDQLIEMGDRDAALDQLRAGLTSLARASLLTAGVFPLARSELPLQLETIRERDLAAALTQTIDAEPSLGEIRRRLRLLLHLQPAGQTHVKRTETHEQAPGRIVRADRA